MEAVPTRLEAIATRVEAVTIRLRPLLLGGGHCKQVGGHRYSSFAPSTFLLLVLVLSLLSASQPLSLSASRRCAASPLDHLSGRAQACSAPAKMGSSGSWPKRSSNRCDHDGHPQMCLLDFMPTSVRPLPSQIFTTNANWDLSKGVEGM